jgi:hypothetical protein
MNQIQIPEIVKITIETEHEILEGYSRPVQIRVEEDYSELNFIKDELWEDNHKVFFEGEFNRDGDGTFYTVRRK